MTTVLGSLPEIRALRPRIQKELPSFDLARFDKLETYAMGLSYAHTQYSIATHPIDALEGILSEGVELREVLLSDATMLTTRGLLESAPLANLKGYNGYKNLAEDLQALASLYRNNWSRISERTSVQLDEAQRADHLAAEILHAVGLREQGPKAVAEVIDSRLRAFTLFVHAYDDARRATLYLSENETAAEKIAPSLYLGRGRSKDTSTATSPTGTTTSTTTPSTGTSAGTSTGTGTPSVPSTATGTKPTAPGTPGAQPFLTGNN